MNNRTDRLGGRPVAWRARCRWRGLVVPLRAQTAVEVVTGSHAGRRRSRAHRFLASRWRRCRTGFAIQAPARIALDVPGATNGMGRNAVEINQGNVRSVNVVQAGDRTRARAEPEGARQLPRADCKASRCWSCSTRSAAAAAAAPRASRAFAESRNRDTQPIKDLDFRRGPDGSGRVVVDLPSNQVGVDIRQQGQNLVVEFLKSSLPEGLRRRMDVTDFGTPVQTRDHLPDGRPRAHGDRAQGRLGAQRLPERQPVRGGSAASRRSTRPS